jgi:hypothetical protein
MTALALRVSLKASWMMLASSRECGMKLGFHKHIVGVLFKCMSSV